MEIVIPDEQYEKLADRAQAAGYADVPSLIAALADEPLAVTEVSADDDMLRQRIEELAIADTSIDAGRGIDAEDALSRIAEKHGLAID